MVVENWLYAYMKVQYLFTAKNSFFLLLIVPQVPGCCVPGDLEDAQDDHEHAEGTVPGLGSVPALQLARPLPPRPRRVQGGRKSGQSETIICDR